MQAVQRSSLRLYLLRVRARTFAVGRALLPVRFVATGRSARPTLALLVRAKENAGHRNW